MKKLAALIVALPVLLACSLPALAASFQKDAVQAVLGGVRQACPWKAAVWSVSPSGPASLRERDEAAPEGSYRQEGDSPKAFIGAVRPEGRGAIGTVESKEKVEGSEAWKVRAASVQKEAAL